MPYHFANDIFHTKKLCSRLSSSEVQLFTQIGRFAVLRPPLGGLRATYGDHFKLIGKRVVDFLLPLIIFFATCYGWGATSEYRLKIGYFARTGVGWPKISGRRGRLYNHSSSQKTRLNDLSYDIKIWTDLSSILAQSTRLTDRQTEFSSLDRVCIPCSAVKTGILWGFPRDFLCVWYEYGD